jgi:hypothetical protein
VVAVITIQSPSFANHQSLSNDWHKNANIECSSCMDESARPFDDSPKKIGTGRVPVNNIRRKAAFVRQVTRLHSSRRRAIQVAGSGAEDKTIHNGR